MSWKFVVAAFVLLLARPAAAQDATMSGDTAATTTEAHPTESLQRTACEQLKSTLDSLKAASATEAWAVLTRAEKEPGCTSATANALKGELKTKLQDYPHATLAPEGGTDVTQLVVDWTLLNRDEWSSKPGFAVKAGEHVVQWQRRSLVCTAKFNVASPIAADLGPFRLSCGGRLAGPAESPPPPPPPPPPQASPAPPQSCPWCFVPLVLGGAFLTAGAVSLAYSVSYDGKAKNAHASYKEIARDSPSDLHALAETYRRHNDYAGRASEMRGATITCGVFGAIFTLVYIAFRNESQAPNSAADAPARPKQTARNLSVEVNPRGIDLTVVF